jgi:L-lactate dehydrogenase complex protein LldG
VDGVGAGVGVAARVPGVAAGRPAGASDAPERLAAPRTAPARVDSEPRPPAPGAPVVRRPVGGAVRAPVSDPLVDQLVAGLTVQSCVVHAPVAREGLSAALLHLIEEVTAGLDLPAVALPDDPLVDEVAATLAAVMTVLRPGDAAWADGIAGAALGIGVAALAAADPGTVALRAGPGSPRTTTLLPPTAVLVVPASSVVADLEAAFARLAADGLPSQVVWVSGPSRTGDLEMVLTFGVHGPRTVHVLVVTDA